MLGLRLSGRWVRIPLDDEPGGVTLLPNTITGGPIGRRGEGPPV